MDKHLRKANPSDAKLIYDWANDDTVRANAINQEKIIWEDHLKWFNKKLTSADYFLVLEIGGKPAGQIRFDFDNCESAWIISYSISADFRGQGLGKVIVAKGIDYVKQYPIVAYVKPDNIPSLKVFEGLSFAKAGTKTVKNTTLVRFQIDHMPEKLGL